MSETYRCINCHAAQRRAFERRGFEYWRCHHCGLLSTYPLPTPSQIEAHYALKFRDGNYRLLQEYSSQYRIVYRDIAARLIRACSSHGRLPSPFEVLDIGCFTGEFLEVLRDAGAEVYGLELQPEAVRIASARLPGRIFQADVFGSEFPTRPKEAVTLLGVIEHVLDPLGLLRRSIDLLKPGGILLLQTPDSASGLARVSGRYWPPLTPVEHIHLFSSKALRLALARLGLEAIEVRRHWKTLPVGYVYRMLEHFGPEAYTAMKSMVRWCPDRLLRLPLPFYAGEVILTGRKPSTPTVRG